MKEILEYTKQYLKDDYPFMFMLVSNRLLERLVKIFIRQAVQKYLKEEITEDKIAHYLKAEKNGERVPIGTDRAEYPNMDFYELNDVENY